jgi:hypothetical protein
MGVQDGNYKQVRKALGIPEDEPVFVIRAQDELAVPIIARYRNMAEIAGCDGEFLSGLDGVQEQFVTWRTDNKTKVPD